MCAYQMFLLLWFFLINGSSGVFRICERRGSRGSGGLTLFVNECLNFDVLEAKISKTTKYIIIKNSGQLNVKGGGRRKAPPLNTPLISSLSVNCNTISPLQGIHTNYVTNLA